MPGLKSWASFCEDAETPGKTVAQFKHAMTLYKTSPPLPTPKATQKTFDTWRNTPT
jgi:hypothetical protein